MNTPHTPGPWSDGIHHARTQGGRTYAHIGNGKNLVPIAAVVLGIEGYGRPEGEANARLIAAAPDLLAVLKELVADEWSEMSDEDLKYEVSQGNQMVVPYIAARAAIAKAEGQS